MSSRSITGIVGAALVAVLTIGLLVWGLGGAEDQDTGDVVQAAGAEPAAPRLPSPEAIASAENDAVTAIAETSAANTADDVAAEDDVTAEDDSAVDSAPPVAAVETSPPPAVAAAAPPPTSTPAAGIAGYQLRVPSLSVNASMIDLGVGADGVMEVPLQAQTVAWYRFTSLPGEPGNTLLGGHITWGGATAVFRYLEDMAVGDVVIIDTPSGETLRYVVREAWWAQPYEQSDVRRVIGSRKGEQTITLFTCGGIWDTDAREYSHRRVVTAVRI